MSIYLRNRSIIFNTLKKMGYRVLYKKDGPRTEYKYTVLISSEESHENTFTCSANSLEESVIDALKRLKKSTLHRLDIKNLYPFMCVV